MSGAATRPESDRPAKAQLLRLADLPATAWKNGGGTTVEYAVHPESAGLDGFDWRVSRARVAAAGPFSIFSGVDRTLTVVEGAGIDLVFADRRTRLDPAASPLAFPADVAVDGRPVDGPIEDLNVMTRRGRWCHRVERLAIDEPIPLELADDLTFVVAGGRIAVTLLGGATFDLGPGDALRIDGPTDLVLDADRRPADALLVGLGRVDRPART